MVRKIILPVEALFRLVGIVLITLVGMVTAMLLLLTLGRDWYLTKAGKKIKQGWTRLVCLLLHIDIDRFGTVNTTPSLIAANHLSWVDIMVIGSQAPCSFVAKSSVQPWPVLGLLASLSGTIFVDRENRRAAMSALDNIVKTLDSGCSVVIFPEGTTTEGVALEKFYPLLFEAAVRGGYPVQSAALYYPRNMHAHSHVPFIGDQSFGPHLLRFLLAGKTDVEVFFCGPLSFEEGHHRKGLAEISQSQIARVLEYRMKYFCDGEALYREVSEEIFSVS